MYLQKNYQGKKEIKNLKNDIKKIPKAIQLDYQSDVQIEICRNGELIMKKVLLGLLIIILLFVACMIVFNRKGNVSNVNIISRESKIYSNNDIDSAIDTAIKYFRKNFRGCSLLEIEYIGDEKNNDYLDWATRNNKDEVIVLISSFKVGSFGGDGSLNPNSKYEDWNWILVRDKNGKWEHVDHGY